jgi:hypothetical protein
VTAWEARKAYDEAALAASGAVRLVDDATATVARMEQELRYARQAQAGHAATAAQLAAAQEEAFVAWIAAAQEEAFVAWIAAAQEEAFVAWIAAAQEEAAERVAQRAEKLRPFLPAGEGGVDE